MNRQPESSAGPTVSALQGKLSFERFLEATEGVWAEWVDGEIQLMAAVDAEHARAVGFFHALLHLYAERRGGEAFEEPFVMKTAADLPGRSPDVFYVAPEHLDRVEEKCLRGPADLVIEILSATSEDRDRGEKLREYEMGGVREYWTIDPHGRDAEFYVLGADGRYRRAAFEKGGVYRSTALSGAWLRAEWLRGAKRPSALSILREWGIV